MAIEIEYTDLFDGELNYSWVRRLVIETDDTKPISMRNALKQVRNHFGIRDVKFIKKIDNGDYFMYKLNKCNLALSITIIF